MNYSLKVGVCIVMTEEIEKILQVVCRVFNAVKLPVVITSGVDGPHRENSLHGKFRAIDIRKIFPDWELSETWSIHHDYIRNALYCLFREMNYPVIVVEESDHIHMEWRDI